MHDSLCFYKKQNKSQRTREKRLKQPPPKNGNTNRLGKILKISNPGHEI